METNQTSPAGKTYRVWADHVNRVYQEADAESPQRAYEIARDRPECWQNCDEFEDLNDYRLADDVQDVATRETFTVGGPRHCRTCGGEIVATVNGSLFGDGECGPCEYRRYISQPALLDAAYISLGFVRSWEKEKGVRGPTFLRSTLESVTNDFHEHAA